MLIKFSDIYKCASGIFAYSEDTFKKIIFSFEKVLGIQQYLRICRLISIWSLDKSGEILLLPLPLLFGHCEL